MEEKQNFNYKHLISLSVILALGVSSFALCIASEIKKTKSKHLKLDGTYCSLPSSNAFGLGIGALVCFFIAHIVGNLIISTDFTLGGRRRCNDKTAILPTISLLLSWVSFSIAIVMMIASISMNNGQRYGEGWLDGDCYIVKDGIFLGSGFLILTSTGLTIALSIMKKGTSESEQYITAPIEQS